MSHDENNFMAWARFRARVDGMIEQVGGAGRAYSPPELEEGEGEHGVVVELMGDWSWRPENQPVDAGFHMVPVDRFLRRVVWNTDTRRLETHDGAAVPAFQPWMVPAHVPSPGMPPRIGPRI